MNNNIFNISQDTIEVDVAFFDENEEKKLVGYPTAAVMQELVKSPIRIPTAEFLTYFLFHRKTTGSLGYQSFDDIGKKVQKAYIILYDLISFNGKSICRSADITNQLPEISEHIGEAIGLSVINRVHGLTEADWSSIPISRGRGATKSFDFQIASDGKTFVQVENKGSSVTLNTDNSLPAIKKHYKNIQDKKSSLNDLPANKVDPNPASLRYGTITGIDARQDGNVRCWLTDPPADLIDDDAKRFKLLRRMEYLQNLIGLISPRSQLAAALATRVADMNMMNDPFELNSLGLRRGNGEPLFLDQNYYISKSHTIDEKSAGTVIPITDKHLMYFAIRTELFELSTKQNFDAIIEFSAKSLTLEESVKCVFSPARWKTVKHYFPESVVEKSENTTGNRSVLLTGKLNYSPGGMVFGMLDIPNN